MNESAYAIFKEAEEAGRVKINSHIVNENRTNDQAIHEISFTLTRSAVTASVPKI